CQLRCESSGFCPAASIAPAPLPGRGCATIRADTIKGHRMRAHGVPRSAQCRALGSHGTGPRQVRQATAVLAHEMVVAVEHAVKTRRAIFEMDDAHALLSGELLQVAIHRTQADARQT